MGGHVPLGYRVQDRKLIISQDDAKTVKFIFNRFLETDSPTQMVDELADVGAVGNRGNSMDTGYIYRILKNRHYLGEIPVGKESFPGEHKAIIDQKTWDKVQAMFASNTRKRHSKRRKHSDALLMGIIRCKHCDRAMTPSHSRKKGKIYRYYVCQTAIKKSYDDCPLCGIPAGDIESVVIQQVRAVLKSPEMVIKTWKEGEEAGSNIQEREVAEALQHIDPVWNELFPAEQQRLIHLLVSQVDVDSDAVKVHLQTEGIDSLAYELKDISNKMEQTV